MSALSLPREVLALEDFGGGGGFAVCFELLLPRGVPLVIDDLALLVGIFATGTFLAV